MKYRDPYGNELPKGVFFDPVRKRYRVRVYYRERPIWLSYHSGYDSAIQAWRDAHGAKRRIRETETGHGVIRPKDYAEALSKLFA